MNIQVEFWQLLTFGVGLLIAFFGAAFAAGKLLGAQWQKGLDERFKAQDEARIEGSALLRKTLDQHLEDEKLTRVQLLALERDFLHWRADLPQKHGERLSRLEEAISAVPTHEDLGELHTKINGVADGVASLRGEFSGAKNVLNMIHEHLLRGNNP